MAHKNQSITVTYFAWDSINGGGKASDVSNHTLRVVTDGSSASPTNSPSEVDGTNAPGLYKITLTASEMNGNTVALHGKSSTSGVSIQPVFITTERGALPNVAPGASGGLPTVDSSNAVKVQSGTGANQIDLSSGKVQLHPDERAKLRGYALSGTTLTFPEGATATVVIQDGQITSITPD
jgi:hypothetical protein